MVIFQVASCLKNKTKKNEETKPAIVLLQMLHKLEAQTLETVEGWVVGQQRQSLPEPTQPSSLNNLPLLMFGLTILLMH